MKIYLKIQYYDNILKIKCSQAKKNQKLNHLKLNISLKRNWDYIRLEKCITSKETSPINYGEDHFMAFLYLNDDFEERNIRICANQFLSEDDFVGQEEIKDDFIDIEIKKGRIL